MAESNALWHATSRKETMDLLGDLWRALDPGGRERLEVELLAGPPDAMLDHLEDGERQSSRDRRIYDRITVIERVGEPALTPALVERMEAIRAAHPQWRASPGEQAHFSSWTEMRWGPDTRLSASDLAAMDDAALIETLRSDQDRREGLLDSWRQFAAAQPKRAVSVLGQIAAAEYPGPADIWEPGWYGLRDAEGEGSGATIDEMMALFTQLPDELFANDEILRGAADLLEARSRVLAGSDEPAVFWALFDRALAAADKETLDHEQVDENARVRRNWVSDAINRSLGRIATAMINMLFGRRPKVGDGIPADLKPRLDALMTPSDPRHRFARVIGASRVSYLYAIDPEWTQANLIPSFSWRDEEESFAMWQAYAWQARIDPQLWAALKPYFLPLFTPERLARLGDWGRNIAQSLMLVGVAFGADEFKREEAREAIRAMPEPMRVDAAAWVAGYMEVEEEEANSPEDEEPIEGAPDVRWNERIWPWLKRVWPTEVALRSAGVAEQFALAAVATEKAFPEAVKAIRAFAVPSRSYHLTAALQSSNHPDEHPRTALDLIDTFLTKDPIMLFEGEIRAIVERIGRADQNLRDDNRYRQWNKFIAGRGP